MVPADGGRDANQQFVCVRVCEEGAVGLRSLAVLNTLSLHKARPGSHTHSHTPYFLCEKSDKTTGTCRCFGSETHLSIRKKDF